ncbi:MAG TPA: phosphoenolpyruvate synthase, partial [Candidatus Kapabacteria bacterium]|nr:phosphoenolpyruvate synthase [Candidatus Kapabacteria bacterium]
LISNAVLPDDLIEEVADAYGMLIGKYGKNITVAVRSSATAEDLPGASFAGQQETYLNISGAKELLAACKRCYASMFTDRAIKYRHDNGFDQMKVALSIGVQIMVRSDKASSGVIFTLDPDTGFRNVVMVTGAWGLGENVVQGTIDVDEFFVFKPALENGAKQPIISKQLGEKDKVMVYAPKRSGEPGATTVNLVTPLAKRKQYILPDNEVITLARWAVIIENHYGRPMDIEWAKDGLTGELFIVQARAETVFSNRTDNRIVKKYELKKKSEVLCTGIGMGERIASGKARILRSPKEADKLKDGEILVTERTSPDWDPILKRAGAIITDKGGRTSHAAIVAREVGTVAVVGAGNATTRIHNGEDITVACSDGETGIIYKGKLPWETIETDLTHLEKPRTKVMLILGDPDQAFRLSFYPNDGIGLMRLEFVITNSIRIHPLALRYFKKLKDRRAKAQIEKLTHHYPNKEDYFVHKLAEGVATIAAAFYPKDVIVRMSDFKTNEYANLIGGEQFEPKEENPMLGWRGASRYYHPAYREGFEMECRAMKIVRDEMNLTNVKLMIPFCRTLDEARKVLEVMRTAGLVRGENGLDVYVMAEIPSNILLADDFAELFDGFSIGSNDLTQLTLGVDRDSEMLSEVFNARDVAVKKLISMLIASAKRKGVKVGLCGQAPSDYSDYAQFLVEEGIDSISFNPDALIKGTQNILAAERKKKEEISYELRKNGDGVVESEQLLESTLK